MGAWDGAECCELVTCYTNSKIWGLILDFTDMMGLGEEMQQQQKIRKHKKAIVKTPTQPQLNLT